MRFASIADVKNHLSNYLARARRRREPIIVTNHGKPWAVIQPINENDLEALGWDSITRERLQDAWRGDEDRLYDYL